MHAHDAPAQVATRLKGAIASKISGYEDMLSKLVAEACVDVCPKNPVNFNVDNVRVVKIPGGGLPDSSVIKGMVLRRGTEGTVQHMENAKVAVYTQGIDTSSTDTKGTVLIKSAQELENYSKCVGWHHLRAGNATACRTLRWVQRRRAANGEHTKGEA